MFGGVTFNDLEDMSLATFNIADERERENVNENEREARNELEVISILFIT